MNKKGFTLVELLAVLSLLAILMIIMISGVNDIFQSSKVMLRDSKINTLLTAATEYANDHINDFANCEDIDNNCYVTVKNLILNGYVQPEESGGLADPTDKSSDGYLNGKIRIKYNKNKLKAIGEEYVE